MYRLEDLRRVGWTQLFGGMATLLAGIAIQIGVGFPWDRTLVNNLIYYVLFAVGWFLFNQIVMAGIYKKLLPEQKRAKLTRLTGPVTSPPTGRFGMLYLKSEIIIMAAWVISVAGLQLLLGQSLTLPMGGFAGGWLVGGGLGRLRFASKIKEEATEQDVEFYFGDSTLGPATQVAFYSDKPEDQLIPSGELAGVAGQATRVALPPGVKRRAVPGASPKKRAGR
jgi:hypothetical protein